MTSNTSAHQSATSFTPRFGALLLLVVAPIWGVILFGQARAESPAWPMTEAAHRAHFCGERAAATDQTAPAGYAERLAAEISTRVAGGASVASAMEQLRAAAGCHAIGKE